MVLFSFIMSPVRLLLNSCMVCGLTGSTVLQRLRGGTCISFVSCYFLKKLFLVSNAAWFSVTCCLVTETTAGALDELEITLFKAPPF